MRKAIVVGGVVLALMLIGTGTVRASVRPSDATVPLSTAVTTPTSAPSTTTTEPHAVETATLTISPTTVHPGESFEARGTCDPPGFQSVVFLDKVFFNSTPASTISVPVPAATPPGRYGVTLDCSSTPRDPPYASAGPVTLTVASPAPPPVPTKLPATT